MPASPILVIWNPGAGSVETAAALREELAAHEGASIALTDTREGAIEQIQKSIQEGTRRIVAAGGDGSANTVIQAVVDSGHSDVEVGLVGLGTGNDLTRTLQIPSDPREAFRLAMEGSARPMDVIEANWPGGRRIVANMSTGGNTGLYMEGLTDEIKRRWGPFCYVRGVVDVLADLHVFEAEFQFDRGDWERYSVLNLFIANGRTSGAGLPVAPLAVPDDGLLDCVIVQDGSIGEVAELTAEYVLSEFLENPLIVHRQVQHLLVRCNPPMKFSIDGDLVTEGDIEFHVLPHAVRIVTPPSGEPVETFP